MGGQAAGRQMAKPYPRTMHKYDGVVTHRTENQDGIVEVVEGKTTRSMHFGTRAK